MFGVIYFLLLLLLVVTVGAVIYVTPTALNLDVQKTRFFFKQKINLGLDLQGGVYMVLGVDFKKVFADVADRLADNLNDDLKKKTVGCGPAKVVKTENGAPTDDPKITLECTSPEAKAKVYSMVKKDYDTFRITDEKSNGYSFGISKLYKDTVREKTISQSIEVIRNRIDEFGVAEPVITSQGLDRLSVELPGIKDVERAKELIGRTAKLEFKIVDTEDKSTDEVAALVSEIEAKNGLSYHEGERFSDFVHKINELAKGKIPANTEIAFEREGRRANSEGKLGRIAYLLKNKADITGDDLKDAYVQIDPQDNKPQVGLRFNSAGADKFDKVTGDNVHKQLAIVLDGIVHSAPNIIQRIPSGVAQITLGTGDYNTLLKEAKDLAIVLRAGALPAQLEFLEQRVVGPSLGADSIQKGKVASMVGCFAVFLFMMVYYRLSGVFADVSLVLNVLFVMAILVGMEATLTLPGIAGIALTVGIAVDSNVVIYERIREELRTGKDPKLAVDAGFSKAFRTILDANVTNAAAAIVLFNYGTGPVKGFAVTLLIGIVTTLFTAIFVCRLLFDWYMDKFDVRELSI
ncbi:MAG: protein translocase subunit SecD [Deltaproteobacteria bacterium]|nr:protein translocase subunit SecD [Deltaproteobacteria bacterium]